MPKSPFKVLHIITALNDGGAEAVLYRLCCHSSSVQHVVISLMGEGRYASMLKEIDVNVHCLNMNKNILSLKGLLKLYKLIRNEKPHVVQTWMYHADLIGSVVARVAGVKNIIWGVHHSTLRIGETKFSTLLIAKINASLSNFIPSKIIYCAYLSKTVHEKFGYCIKKSRVVNNGYDVSYFDKNEEARNKFRSDNDLFNTFVVGHVGRFDALKDYPNLVKALSIVKNSHSNFKLSLVGSNLVNYNKELAKIISDNNMGSHVLMLGRRNDIMNVMNGFDLFVLSSYSEAFPNVLSESMACYTPCVTTDVGDASVIVGDTGWVANRKDPEALASAIIEALLEKNNNSYNWEKRRNLCRQRVVDNFSIDKMVAGYLEVWNKDN